jgi:Ig-like domain CHU_C associated
MPMSPTFTTTYYASAFNGSCFSARTPVTVTVTPAPNVMTIDASPDTVCIGLPSNLVATTCSQVLGFGGLFAPSNWVTTHSPITDAGIVHPAGAPTSIAIESSNGGNFGLHSVLFTTTMQCSGTVSFNWSYVTTDVDGSAYDYPEYAVNMVNMGMLPGFVPGGPNSQSGTFALPVTVGQQFSLIMTASDDILGSATTVYTNFSAPGGASGATINWFPVLTGGTSLGSSLAGINFPVTPGVTTTYYAAATLGGCTSTPRVPIQVVAQNCVLPIEEVYLLGLTDGNAHSLAWSQSHGGPNISYEVERSADGLAFAPIGLVDAGLVEGEQVQFSYLDNRPLPADNFYRLRYLGPDGDMRYTNTVRLRLADALSSFSLAPSPTRDATTYRFFSTRAYQVDITLTDLLGRTVLQARHQVQPGNNAIPLDVRVLEHGTYMMQAHHLGTQARHSGVIVKVD